MTKHLRTRHMRPKPAPAAELDEPAPLPPGQWVEGCQCMRCANHWANLKAASKGMRGWVSSGPGFRYACEECGNKRCPHHSDHRLECSGSNEPGQPGSAFT